MNSGRYRKLHIYIITTFLLSLVLFLGSSVINQDLASQVNQDGGDSFIVSEEEIHGPSVEQDDGDSENRNFSGHYNLLVIISSSMEELKSRKLLRKYLFGINNNLYPCMRQETNIYYKFLVRPYKNVKRTSISRNYTAESVEYNDIIEFQDADGQNWQKTILEWARSLNEKRITYNHVAILDVHSIINLKRIQQILDSSVINGHLLTTKQKSNLVWSLFDVRDGDDMFVVLGQKAIAPIIEQEEEGVNIITQAYHHYQNHNSEKSPLYFVNDPIGMMEWSNAIENVPIETTIAIGHVYQEEEVRDLVAHLNLQETKICYPRTHKDKPSIAIVTSSFVYENFCMFPAAIKTAENKRKYALRNGYSFVARSSEFAQQHYKKRKPVWGKIDVVEKVLPHYDWIFWIDMDAVIANPVITIENLLEQFTALVGGKEKFNDINLIIARPKGDMTINAGVFLMRNSDWSKRFLRDAQKRENFFNTGMYEQRAMWDLIKKPKYKSGTLLLDQDDHTFNTFPHAYNHGDFVVHFAPEGCPAKQILDALVELKKLEEDPDTKIIL